MNAEQPYTDEAMALWRRAYSDFCYGAADQAAAAVITAAMAEKDADIARKDEAIKRQAAAVRTLQASEATEINILRKERHKAHEAIKTLESERAANALLTDELEATKAELQALREALRQCRKAVSHGSEEPRRNVREIVDEALTRKDA
jgi:peptidoglycan hydrolase-like amidase